MTVVIHAPHLSGLAPFAAEPGTSLSRTSILFRMPAFPEGSFMSAISTTARLGIVGAGVAALTSTVLALGASAAAAPSVTGSTLMETATHQQCVAEMDTTSMRCFQTEQEADAYANARQATSAWKVHVILYDPSGYAKPSIRLGSEGKCTKKKGDVDGVQPDLGDLGWNDRASSFVTRNRCDMKAWNGKGYDGKHFKKYRDHDIELTGLNNKISSFKTT
ncbi:hypothetical protein ACH35V_15010 [Actinomadura sp. 1N219]|uniref:hypothetical protein n=1 Tax=Actinomadura sp. 1N219 TaxID=3375152 RepID=UPI0037A2D3C5